MSTLKPFYYGRFQKFAVLTFVSCLLMAPAAFAQTYAENLARLTGHPVAATPSKEVAPVASNIDPSTFGTVTYVKDEKGKDVINSYISEDGIVFHVGDRIKLTTPAGYNNRYANIRRNPYPKHTNPTDQYLPGDYVNKNVIITNIAFAPYEKLVFGGGSKLKLAYLYFQIPGDSWYYEITVEPALNSNEFKLVQPLVQ
jgi:hypothetical protein